MRGRRAVLQGVGLAIGLLVLASPIAGAERPCADEKSGQFDFWIGEWKVTAGGKLAGTNSIRPILDGCVLQETWAGAQGSSGSSLNHYDPTTGKWHQYWVWHNGSVLRLVGEYSDGKMVLSGETTDRQGKKVLNRITWYDNDDGTVRQHWEQSADGGKTWNDTFDGLYSKKG